MAKRIVLFITVFFLAGIFLSGFYREALAITGEEVFKKAQNINPTLKDYTAKLKIRVSVKLGISIPMRMRADYYYKAPDKVKIKIKQAPSFLNKYPQVFSSNLPDLKDFNCSLDNSQQVNNEDCYLLVLVPKQPMGDLLRHELFVNKKNFTIPKQKFFYNNNGEIEVLSSYIQMNGAWLFKEIAANFSFPKISLSASMNAEYYDYRLNQGLSDDLFKQEN